VAAKGDIMRQTMNGFALLALEAASLSSLFGQHGVQFAPHKVSQELTTSRATAPAADSVAAPHCEVLGTQEIRITCTYTPTPHSSPRGKDQRRIVLNRALLSFGTEHESFMVVKLTLTNEGTKVISEPHAVYLAVDDETGQNMVRRILPKVDISKLFPGLRVTFSEQFLVGGFRSGRYSIYLSIPNLDPLLKSDPTHNLLLSSMGVSDPSTGRITLAHFNVER